MTQWSDPSSQQTPPPQPPANEYAAQTYGGVAYAPPRRNAAGLTGFILSVLSIFCCGVLAPVGLLVSVIGLFKAPRGFAVAGTIIGGLLSLVLLLGLVGIVSMWDLVSPMVAVSAAEPQVRGFHSTHGRLPDAQEYDQLLQSAVHQLPGFMQPGSITYQYDVVSDTQYEVTLPGFDGRLGTGDDITQPFTVPPSRP